MGNLAKRSPKLELENKIILAKYCLAEQNANHYLLRITHKNIQAFCEYKLMTLQDIYMKSTHVLGVRSIAELITDKYRTPVDAVNTAPQR